MPLTKEQQLAYLLSGRSSEDAASHSGQWGDSAGGGGKYQGAGMDWDPQQYSKQAYLLNKLSPDMATKLEGINARAKSMSVDPSMNADLRRAFGEQSALLSGGTNLGEYEAARTSPSQMGGGSASSGWSSNNSANAGLAQNLMRDQTAAADAHQKQALAAGKTNTDMVDSYGGVKESKKDRRDFLLQVLGLVR